MRLQFETVTESILEQRKKCVAAIAALDAAYEAIMGKKPDLLSCTSKTSDPTPFDGFRIQIDDPLEYHKYQKFVEEQAACDEAKQEIGEDYGDFKSDLASSAMLSKLLQHPGFVDWWDRLNSDEQRKIIEEAKVDISKAVNTETNT